MIGPATPPEGGTASPSTGGRASTEVEHTLDGEGFDGQFGARPDGQILCFTCRAEFAASSVEGDHASRVEGASDPADMSIAFPLTCPACGADGTLVVQYGPQASEEEAEVVLAIDRTPDTELGGPHGS